MTPEQIQRYKDFDIIADNRWKAYINTVYPAPNLEQLDKLKKKWYKNNVDSEFDVNADLSTVTPQQQQSTESQNSHRPSINIANNKAYMLEGYLKCVFLVLSLISNFSFYIFGGAMVVSMCSAYLGMVRQIGNVQFNTAYLIKAIQNEFGMILFFNMVLVGFGKVSVFNWLPLILFYAIGVAEFSRRMTSGPLKHEKLQPYIQMIIANKNDIKIARGYIEVFSLFYYLLIAVLGKFSLITMFIYGHYIKFKYKHNQYTNWSVNQTKAYLNEKVGVVPVAGALLNKAVNGVFWLITV